MRRASCMLVSLFAMSLFMGSCQSDEESSESNLLPIYLGKVRIGNVVPTSSSRYEHATGDVSALFTKDDKIGVFVNEEAAVRWTYETTWSPESESYWEDRTSAHTFYAFYPYPTDLSQQTSPTSVKMPDLSKQKGKWSDLPQYDFLVASVTTNYNACEGNVDFSGDHAFNHVSSLLELVIKREGSITEEATITEVILTGTNLVTASTYSFEDSSVTLSSTDEKNTLTCSATTAQKEDDFLSYFILNAREADASKNDNLTLTIKYTVGGKSFIATRTDFAPELLEGRQYKYNLQIRGGSVVIVGGSISNWEVGNGDGETIVIDGEEEA